MKLWINVELCQGVVDGVRAFASEKLSEEDRIAWLTQYNNPNRDELEHMSTIDGTELLVFESEVVK